MEKISALEQLITVRIVQEDCEAIYSLMGSERDPIFMSEMLPYYSLFIQSCQELLGENYISSEVALKIKDIRNQIKSYSDSFGKSRRKVSAVDQEEDLRFKSQLRFDFLGSWDIHYNLGTYWTDDFHIIGNTQQLAAIYGDEYSWGPEIEKKHFELGEQIGSFIVSARNGLAKALTPPVVERNADKIEIKYYHDFNTNKHNDFFAANTTKELRLFYLHLLCNMNFVKYILRSLFSNGNTWAFRVEYIVTYYTLYALRRLKNYSENNTEIAVETEKIDEIINCGSSLFQSKFRNCMMHYDLKNQGVLSLEYIEKPFFGIIETCFSGMDYQTYLDSLRRVSDKIIAYLEEQFNFTNVELERL